jgi:tetratricopeptide (TPR) repeat protein
MAHTLDGQGDRQSAASCYQQSVEIFRDLGDQWALTHPLCDLAWRIWDEGRLHEAMALMQEYLDVFRDLRSAGAIPMALGYITNMAIVIGDFATASRAAQEKAEIDLSRGLPIDQAYGLYSVASVNFAQGNLAQSRRQLESAHKIARKSGDHSFTADIELLLARVAVSEGSPAQATTLFDTSKRSAKEGEPRPLHDAHVLLGLGQVACLSDDFSRAARLFRESLEQIRVIRPEIPGRLEGLAHACLGLGQAAQAATLLAPRTSCV